MRIQATCNNGATAPKLSAFARAYAENHLRIRTACGNIYAVGVCLILVNLGTITSERGVATTRRVVAGRQYGVLLRYSRPAKSVNERESARPLRIG
jgi:hypothetical protein